MFCNHKYGKVEDGYQYCEKCGKAKIVPCNHKWETIDKYREEFMVGSNIVYVKRCVFCGTIEKFSLK